MASARLSAMRHFGRPGRVTHDHPARDDPAGVTAAISSPEQGATGARRDHLGRVPTLSSGFLVMAIGVAVIILAVTYVTTERRELVRSPSAALAPTSLTKADRLDVDQAAIVTGGTNIVTSPGRSIGLEAPSPSRPSGGSLEPGSQ